ncbi:MAG: diphosphatase [Pseudonocardiales bacterium]|nr:diphosphatase [Pseudonocardiales bacterium]
MVEVQQPVPVPVLSRSAHDRIAHRRTDAHWLEAAWQSASSLVLVLSAAAEARSASGTMLDLLHPAEVDVDGDRILLGEAEGRVYFAVLAYTETGTTSLPGNWRGLRELAVQLGDLDVGLLTTAVALQHWHQRHTHCPRCGTVTELAQAGWTRVCPHDGSEHFPRTDPAVIMLITDGQDRCLLARSPLWPEGRMSVLAGFVEAGESAEAAVAREVGEEVGISVGDIRYVASQPHPFPSSLMLGYTAHATGDPTLQPDHDEIAEAGWFTRDEVRAARDWGDERGEEGSQEGSGAQGMLRALPPTMSIARQLIDSWIASG